MRISTLSSWEKFEPCRDYGVFAGNKNTFGGWQIGEPLILLIGELGVVLARVIGKVFYSNEMIWSNDVFGWRVKIEISKEFAGEVGTTMNIDIRKILRDSIGSNYGYILRNRSRVANSIEKMILKIVEQ